ncbi:MAG: hypothetical protein KDA21_11940, partial [Phycisphaerales bacterium]|nr:hypothetical protein [Phycisphaerales bacterium]
FASGCASSGTETRRGGAVDGQYAFWPLAPDEPRVQFLKSFVVSSDVQPRKRSNLDTLIFGSESEEVAAIDKPSGVAMSKGRIYVCDIRKEAVVVFDVAARQMRIMGSSGVNRLGNPVDICIADDGMIYVADNSRNAVIEFTPKERYSRALGRSGMRPTAVAVGNGRVYVSDGAGQKILILDRSSGEVVGEFGSAGDGEGQFRFPLGLDVDREGRVNVVDFMRCRVQRFTPDGAFIDGFGELGDYAGAFAKPKHMTVDSEGIIYVVDSAFQNVQLFNDDFRMLMHFGSAGDYPGAMNLPMGVCTSDDDIELFADLIHPGFDARRLVVVTNQFGDQKVSLYALGQLRDGWTVAQVSASSLEVPSGMGENAESRRLQASGDEPEPLPEEEEPSTQPR